MDAERWMRIVTDLCVLHGRQVEAEQRVARIQNEVVDDLRELDAAQRALQIVSARRDQAFGTVFAVCGPQIHADLSLSVALIFDQAADRFPIVATVRAEPLIAV